MYIFDNPSAHQACPSIVLNNRANLGLCIVSQADDAVIWVSGMGLKPLTRASVAGHVGAVYRNYLIVVIFTISSFCYFLHVQTFYGLTRKGIIQLNKLNYYYEHGHWIVLLRGRNNMCCNQSIQIVTLMFGRRCAKRLAHIFGIRCCIQIRFKQRCK